VSVLKLQGGSTQARFIDGTTAPTSREANRYRWKARDTLNVMLMSKVKIAELSHAIDTVIELVSLLNSSWSDVAWI